MVTSAPADRELEDLSTPEQTPGDLKTSASAYYPYYGYGYGYPWYGYSYPYYSYPVHYPLYSYPVVYGR